MRSKPTYFIFVIIAGLIAFGYILFSSRPSRAPIVRDIATFEECAAAGYPIMETYPEQCRTPDGRSFTRVTPQDSPSDVTLTGTYTCLPKKDTGGPVTLECAFGLQKDGEYYALDLSSIPTVDYPALNGGEEITVEGTLVPIEMISSDRWQTYIVKGIVSVDKIRML